MDTFLLELIAYLRPMGDNTVGHTLDDYTKWVSIRDNNHNLYIISPNQELGEEDNYEPEYKKAA